MMAVTSHPLPSLARLGVGLLGRRLLRGLLVVLDEVEAAPVQALDLLVRDVHRRPGETVHQAGHQAFAVASSTTANAFVSMMAKPYTTSRRIAIWLARFRSPEPSGSPKRMTSTGI